MEQIAQALDRDFPLTKQDAMNIALTKEPMKLARELMARFSPKWFLGWRDITNVGNERTIIACATPKVPIGHTFPLFFAPGVPGKVLCALLANLNSLVTDYAARQKVGGTHITYNFLKQFPIMPPDEWSQLSQADCGLDFGAVFSRVLELVYTAADLAPLAKDCGYDAPPFVWDDDRRFEIRCELDAASFHLYLPCDAIGGWRRADGETSDQLAALQKHFPTPRDAVAFILDQFPIVRQKDEQAHSRYRTRERILEIYDAMLAARRSGSPYQTRLDPPPGTGS
jgi:hypothetical protein